MDITEIIKDAFVFPSKNLGALAIYIVLSIVVSFLAVGGIFTSVFGIMDSGAYIVIGAILFIISLIIGFIMSGYQVSVIKSGIDFDEEAPGFEWVENLMTGVKNVIVAIVYFIIPAIIVSIVGILTNVPGNIAAIVQEAVTSSVNATAIANATSPSVDAVSQAAINNLAGSLAITGAVALVLFIIFSFIQTMGEARLANTGSLGEALNVPEAAKDITRIGVGKVIGLIILIVVIIAVIEIILVNVYNYVPYLSILSIIITPYLAFFTQRAVGLLYSDIA